MMNGCKLILPVMFMVVFSSITAVEADILEERIAFYKTCLDDVALKCKNKCCLRHSSSDQLRKCAEMAAQKMGFIKNHHDDLITEMLTENIELKEYKVKYYINRRFFQTFRYAPSYLNRDPLQENNI
jgi:hypothetical protein